MKRRNFLRNSGGLAGLALTGLAINPAESASRPADLKITDIRGCTVRAGGENYPIIKIYTNQDVYGLGEVRDSGRLSQALIYKSFLVGQDPLNIEGHFEKNQTPGRTKPKRWRIQCYRHGVV